MTELPCPWLIRRFIDKETEIYLHLDVDIINPVDAPAMLYQSSGRPRLSELKKFIETIKEKIVAVSVTMWEPSLDKDKQTEKAVFELIRFLNKNISSNQN